MPFQLLSTASVTTLLLTICILIMRRLQTSLFPRAEKKPDNSNLMSNSAEPTPTALSKRLASALPDNILLPHHGIAFKESMNSHWAQQESEVRPACIVRPNDVRQVCTAITILKEEYDERARQDGNKDAQGIFAVRGGGHSPVPGAATVRGGVVIDLSLLRQVTPSEDGSSVTVGAGAKWIDVSQALDKKGLAVVGGRNSAVGVGGLTLGGGLSFFSPRFGLVCNNILSYEIVLASGSVATASESTNADLWRALKGGSNNFGIVTRFTFRSFPCTKIWSGFLYMPSSQATKVLAAFYDYVNKVVSADSPSTTYDDHSAGPIVCFSYIQQLRLQAIAVNLVYTKTPEEEGNWPTCWKTSAFAPLWRLWSTCKVRTLTSATDEMNALNPPGRRQVFAALTIKNDPPTIDAAHAAYRDAITPIRRLKVKGMVWTLVLQPLLPEWARKGDPNPLGLSDSNNDPLVILSFTVNWDERKDDDFVQQTTRRVVDKIEAIAAANGAGHRYRYLNYCAKWQRPFEGYGEENWRSLQDTSRKYDPDGMFQMGCTGGFKLEV